MFLICVFKFQKYFKIIWKFWKYSIYFVLYISFTLFWIFRNISKFSKYFAKFSKYFAILRIIAKSFEILRKFSKYCESLRNIFLNFYFICIFNVLYLQKFRNIFRIFSKYFALFCDFKNFAIRRVNRNSFAIFLHAITFEILHLYFLLMLLLYLNLLQE